MNNSQAEIFSAADFRFPIAKRDYTVITPMMEDLLEVVTHDIENMESGICVWGTSRFGKTTAKEFVISELKKQKPSLTIVEIIMGSVSRDTDYKFFMYFEQAGLISQEDDRDAGQLATMISRRLLINCSQNQDPRILITIDEAQRMTINRFSFLIDLTNRLEHLGLAPTVWLIGQPEILDLRNQLITKKRKDVIGRFLDDPTRLEGTNEINTIQKVFDCYDNFEKMEFPKGSKICITSAYVYDLYKSGFRLGTLAPSAWEAIENSAKSLRITPVMGMKTLTRIIQTALTKLAEGEDIMGAKTSNWWVDILKESGYLRQLARDQGDGENAG